MHKYERKNREMRTYSSSSAAESSLPVEGLIKETMKNLFLRMTVMWLCLAGSNLRAVSDGITGYREEWNLYEGIVEYFLYRIHIYASHTAICMSPCIAALPLLSQARVVGFKIKRHVEEVKK